MPEIVTKYPEIVLKILSGTGAECGIGATKRILTTCPPERFCSLPTGEICVYGLDEIQSMTQITASEILKTIDKATQTLSLELALITIFAFFVGIIFGMLLQKRIFSKRVTKK